MSASFFFGFMHRSDHHLHQHSVPGHYPIDLTRVNAIFGWARWGTQYL
jgi:hypothetical protein